LTLSVKTGSILPILNVYPDEFEVSALVTNSAMRDLQAGNSGVTSIIQKKLRYYLAYKSL